MNEKINPKIETGWLNTLDSEFEQPYFSQIKQFLLSEKQAGKTIYPAGSLIFNAFNLTPIEKVKVVILGQDPYHNEGQAHGLCFSVADGVPPPPSLENMFKELQNDLGIPPSRHGNLTAWANQGVFLLNAILTVEAHKPASHQKIGWQQFTDAVIQKISDQQEGIVFMLWGNFAKSKIPLIDASKHHILTAGHPSPLSARLFFGCRHFSKANELLEQQGKTPIDWYL